MENEQEDKLQLLLESGEKLEAIRWVKENYSVSLKEAHEFIETLESKKKQISTEGTENSIKKERKKSSYLLLTGVAVMLISGIIWFGQKLKIDELISAENNSTQSISSSTYYSQNTLDELDLRNDIVRLRIQKRKAQETTAVYFFIGLGITIIGAGWKIKEHS